MPCNGLVVGLVGLYGPDHCVVFWDCLQTGLVRGLDERVKQLEDLILIVLLHHYVHYISNQCRYLESCLRTVGKLYENGRRSCCDVVHYEDVAHRAHEYFIGCRFGDCLDYSFRGNGLVLKVCQSEQILQEPFVDELDLLVLHQSENRSLRLVEELSECYGVAVFLDDESGERIEWSLGRVIVSTQIRHHDRVCRIASSVCLQHQTGHLSDDLYLSVSGI